MSGLTARFAAELAALGRDGLGPEAEVAATALVRDGLAVAALGACEPGPSILAALAVEADSRPAASLIGPPRASVARVSPHEAARVNGASMHVLDYEPMWNPANHALSTTLPALLALAEDEARRAGPVGVPIGRRLLAALAVGIEAQARLRRASGQFEPADIVFHPPGTVGPIGSAVACGLYLGLDGRALAHAIGIAASRAGTIMANVGSMTKALHCGQAAAAGLDSVGLAVRGFTADPDALAGPRGFGRAFFGDRFDPDELMGHGAPLHILSPGPAYKLYPSQYGTHFVIAASLEARGRLAPGARIERVRVICPPMPYVTRPAPESGLAGKFSFQYVAAAALLDGRVDVETFMDARRFAPDLSALLGRVTVEPDPAREGRFDRMAVDVVVEVADGTRAVGHCDGPPGIWGRPVAPERLAAKALDCFEAAFGDGWGARLIAETAAFPDLDGPGLIVLMDGLAGVLLA